MTKAIKLCVLIGLIMLLVLQTGCTLKVDAIRKSADPITENLLVALNEDNYAKYSQDFDQDMKNALTEETFKQGNPVIKAKIGRYISKEFISIESKGQYTTVYYKAKFSLEPGDVIVKNVVTETGGRMYISGFWLDSPNLQK